jgi:hypothetical protein
MGTSKRNYKRLVLGDVVEIPLTKRRVAYAQYIYSHRELPRWGDLIRVFPGIFRLRPDSFSLLAKQQERFCAFFPAGAAVSRGIVTIVSHEVIPDRCKKLPLFKDYNQDGLTGEKLWFLWDGKRDIEIGKLPQKYHDLPMCEIVNMPLLVGRISKGWSPRDEV